MRIIIMGTGPFCVPPAQRLLSDGHDIPLVVTRPLPEPHPKKLPPRPVYDWAVSSSIPIFEPPSINDASAIEKLAGFAADLFFVCDYGQILSRDALSASRLGGINLHGSILPRHRGAAPVQWTLLSGDVSAGVTVIHMTPRLDAGPTLSVATTLIEPHETAETLEPRLAELGVASTMDAVAALEAWDGVSAIGRIQDASTVTRAPRFAKSDGQIDFRHPADYIVRLVRACQPWPSTFAQLGLQSGKSIRVMIRAAQAIGASESAPSGPAGAVKVVAVEGQPRQMVVATGEGLLQIDTIQPAGKRAMAAEEFLRGHDLANAQFELPSAKLQQLTDTK